MFYTSSLSEPRIEDRSREVICSGCGKGKLIYDRRTKEFIYVGACFKFKLCALIMRGVYEHRLKMNEELNRSKIIASQRIPLQAVR